VKLRILKSIAWRALESYDVSVARLRFYGEHSNILYTVDDTGGHRFVLKVMRPGDHALPELLAAADWHRKINRRAPELCMRLVPSCSGENVVTVDAVEVDETRYCALYEWVPGMPLYRRLSRPGAWKWGRLAAGLHQATTRAYPPGELAALRTASPLMTWDTVFYWDAEVLFDAPHRRWISGARRDTFRAATDHVQSVLDELFAGASAPTLIHADLHPDNVRVHNGTLTALDVEDVMWGYPVQDVAIALLYIRNRADYPQLLSSFREGYESVLAWPLANPVHLEALFAGRLLMFANFILKLDDFDDEEREQTLARYERSFREWLP
jgi:Ser/Thr protein kinase RdoA (MazF antagonist)